MPIDPKYEKYTFLIFLLIGLYLSYVILESYLLAVIGGGIIAYLLYPFYKIINTKIKRRAVSATIVSLTAFLLVGGIIALTIPQIVTETKRFYFSAESFFDSQQERIEACDTESIFYCPFLTPFRGLIEGDNFKSTSLNIAQRYSSFIFTSVPEGLGSIATILLNLTIMAMAVFYFLENGRRVSKKAFDLLPLHKSHEDILVSRIKDTLDAVVKGNIVTSFLQGALGGLAFYILGINSPFLWGIIMTILAFIPVAGAALIWFPAAIILMITGSLVNGIILLLFGFFVLGYIDNILKPKIIGDKINTSSFIIFLGVIGGLAAFGVIGMFLGPLIISITVVLLDFFKDEIIS